MIGQRFFNGGGQDGVRAGLDEDLVSGVEGGADGPVELHCLADVLVPVVGVEASGIREVTCHGGEEGDGRRAGFDAGEGGGEFGPDGVDVGGVRRVVDVDPAGPDVGRVASPDQFLDGGHFSGDDDRRNTVDRSDIQTAAAVR
ncbi:hypothetical protein LAUMK13_02463 [Mycobacterium innocens]|uniref:Uncharacterized protein n=1 Tax=Mycobacterium innocens TaxID=2341083 RepID=A0A498Q476_9MYCO|nr:hypothetical protein LAUMK13_02463 [Mycobacterium innocens]